MYLCKNNYQPNIKSDIWPSMPFPGDCPGSIPPGNPTAGGALFVATALCVGDCPGFRKAAAEGANLIGVPYDEAPVCP